MIGAVRWPASLQGVQARLALQCVVSLLIAFAVMRLLASPKPYWLALTALMVSANSFGETAAKSVERIAGTVAGLLAGELIWLAAAGDATVPAALIVVCIFALFYERNAHYRTMLFWLSLLLALIFHLADAPSAFYVARLVDTLAGAAIAVFVTRVLLPVRTGDAVQMQMAGLLDLAADRLRQMAATLSRPGPHAREGDLGAVRDAAEKLQSLAAAEGLEAVLLRRPRAETRRRLAASDQIARCLLYADQLLPMLPDDFGTLSLLRTVAAGLGTIATGVREGAIRPAGTDPLPEARARAAAAYQGARITLAEYQASLRLHEALAGLTEAAARLAVSAPAPAPGVRAGGETQAARPPLAR